MMHTIEMERVITPSPEDARAVIADMAGYADLTTDGITKVEVLECEGVRMLHRCFNNRGQSWTETCPVWDEGRQFHFVVHTDVPDYPYPLSYVEGQWFVEENPHGTRIRARFRYAMKNKLVGWLLERIAEGNAIRDTEHLLISGKPGPFP